MDDIALKDLLIILNIVYNNSSGMIISFVSKCICLVLSERTTILGCFSLLLFSGCNYHPREDSGIEYDLGKKVETFIKDSIVERYGNIQGLYICSDSSTFLFFLVENNVDRKIGTNERFLLENTNRFVRIDGERIPFYFLEEVGLIRKKDNDSIVCREEEYYKNKYPVLEIRGFEGAFTPGRFIPN